MEGRCKLWIPKKNRFCANSPLPTSPYCGNHTARSNCQWVPCPIDPSHTVLQENLQSHLKRCPLLKQTQSLSLQPFYQKRINAGTESEFVLAASEIKRSAVYSMSVYEFSKLITKIRSIHASICNFIPDSFKIPQACSNWTDRQAADSKLPYEEKHVLQQASILGNLEEFGVLKQSSDHHPAAAVVEFGAGRGYLTQLLADCYGFKNVVLVERKPYKLKADRSLRQKEGLRLERLRIDIEDLNLRGVECLRGVMYLALGKHLCGPATDMTLRCCMNEPPVGVAIATCCHHLCQWRDYINKEYMLNLGVGMEEFNALTWFTSWAVDAAADHGSDLNGGCTGTEPQTRGNVAVVDVSGVEGLCKSMKAVDRAALGFMCKDIIDAGRISWLKEVGFECEMVKYVPSSISPENHLLLARKK
ncbi:unnamed protein product [Cuscuta epithymum]|uniref:tRNA:m(4)X modification enzyme TRM13 n=1 Tax=Cuscuta epithymum TaxID=186058 RepID=A0AAV0FGD6_9ASTE|nr:unnamed protein product [Cuscuta epithymum]